jgi:hypothetical protein
MIDLAKALRRTDYLRRSPASLGEPSAHKEWLHFCVIAPDLAMLINFSVCDDVFPLAEPRSEVARLTVLIHDPGGWHGAVDTFDPNEVEVCGGAIALRFSDSFVRLEGHRYRVRARSSTARAAVDLVFEPLVYPAIAPNIPLNQSPPLHWTVVPRLRVDGTVEVAGRRHRLVDAVGYHDHNWGDFAWGHDLSWEWGFCVPVDPRVPWSFACVCLSNRARTQVLAQGLFLWRGAHRVRTFRDDDVVVSLSPDYLPCPDLFKIPTVMHLVFPDQRTDVPTSYRMQAVADGDELEFEFAPADLAQVVIPTEVGLGVTVINEVHGHFTVQGRVGGEAINHRGEGFLEFLSA